MDVKERNAERTMMLSPVSPLCAVLVLVLVLVVSVGPISATSGIGQCSINQNMTGVAPLLFCKGVSWNISTVVAERWRMRDYLAQ